MLREDVKLLKDTVEKLKETVIDLSRANLSTERALQKTINKVISLGWAVELLGKKGIIEPGEIAAHGKIRIKDSIRNKEAVAAAELDGS